MDRFFVEELLDVGDLADVDHELIQEPSRKIHWDSQKVIHQSFKDSESVEKSISNDQPNKTYRRNLLVSQVQHLRPIKKSIVSHLKNPISGPIFKSQVESSRRSGNRKGMIESKNSSRAKFMYFQTSLAQDTSKSNHVDNEIPNFQMLKQMPFKSAPKMTIHRSTTNKIFSTFRMSFTGNKNIDASQEREKLSLTNKWQAKKTEFTIEDSNILGRADSCQTS